MTQFIRDFFVDESGAAAAEYVLLLAVIGGGIAVGALALGNSINGAMGTKATYINTCSADHTKC